MLKSVLAIVWIGLSGAAWAQLPQVPDTCLVVTRTSQAGRAPTRFDPVEHRFVTNTWTTPAAGDTVQGPQGQRSWETAAINEKGEVQRNDLVRSYVCVQVPSTRRQVVLLNARRHSMVYVNGHPRGGDPYGYGYLDLPILLEKGDNELVFSCSRGGLSLRFKQAPAPVYIQQADMTLPDHLDDGDKWVGLVVVNATQKWQEDVAVQQVGGPTTQIGSLAPLTIRKVPVRVTGGPEVSVRIAGTKRDVAIKMRKRTTEQTHRRTFLSKADGSVQYYAVNPARKPGDDNALILSLHGASVEAQGQADAYGPHDWATIVCPTNRRPFGFDWEDWGRYDALEVLEQAEKTYPHDPLRTCLTGHSMGGHGTWQLAALFPDKWAAIGPSAGWISFSTYTGAARPEGDGIPDLLRRSTGTSDTLAMKPNFWQHGIFILHGDADDNVPVGQARQMKKELADHPNVRYHEQAGAGHWWDGDPAPGAACVDFKPMFDFFRENRRTPPHETTKIDFTTANPEVSDSCQWITIVAQTERLKPSRVQATWDPAAQKITCTTENVLEIAFDLDALRQPQASIEIDGVQTTPGARTFARAEDKWLDLRMVSRIRPDTRGSFKNGFWERGAARGPLRLELGLSGDVELDQALLDKARYDAETFYYRGNGNAEIVRSKARGSYTVTFAGRPATEPMVEIGAGQVRIGEEQLTGDDMAVLSRGFQRVDVGGTGPVGIRLTHRMPYFVSGIDYPDTTVFGPEMLLGQGVAGVRAVQLGARTIVADTPRPE